MNYKKALVWDYTYFSFMKKYKIVSLEQQYKLRKGYLISTYSQSKKGIEEYLKHELGL